MCPVNQGLAELPDTACCLQCGYALRGLPEARCPECGTTFDPLDPMTYYDPARRRRPGLGPLRPVYRRELLYAWAAALIVVVLRGRGAWVLRVEGIEYEAPVMTYLGVGYAFAWLWWRYAIWVRRRQPHLLGSFMRHHRRFRWMQWGIALYVLTMLYPWPAALRFMPQLPVFSAYAKQYLADPNTPTGPVQIGFEQVVFIWGRGQGFVWFAFDRDRHCGLVRYSIDPDQAYSGLSRPRVWIWPGWCLESWNP